MILNALIMANQYSNLIIAVTSVLLFIVTAVYALFTRRMVREMQLARIADLRPYIIVDTVLIGRIFYLVVKNKGKTAAHMVKFKIDKNVTTMWKDKLGEMPIFNSGVTFCAPGKEFIITLGPDALFLGKDSDETKYPKTFTITVEYVYFGKIKESESTQINLEEYMQTRAYPNEVAKAIEDAGAVLGKGLSSIVKSTEKLSKLEELSSPTGLDLSQGTLYRLAGLLGKESEGKIRFDINLTTLMEFVELLGIDSKVAEKILEKRYTAGYFKTFDDLKDIAGMTDTILENIRNRTFICTPNY